IRARNASGTIEFYDSNAANTGAGHSITLNAAGSTNTLGLTAGATPADNITDAGNPSGTQSLTINGVAVTLNGDDHKTAAQAATAINAALKSAGAPAGLKASAADGKLTITGPDSGAAVTIAGGEADAVFGVSGD